MNSLVDNQLLSFLRREINSRLFWALVTLNREGFEVSSAGNNIRLITFVSEILVDDSRRGAISTKNLLDVSTLVAELLTSHVRIATCDDLMRVMKTDSLSVVSECRTVRRIPTGLVLATCFGHSYRPARRRRPVTDQSSTRQSVDAPRN